MHLRTLAVALASFFPLVASAASFDNLYFGARAGATSTSMDSGKLTTELRSRGHNVTAQVDDTDIGGEAYVGRMLTPNFALEMGLRSLGEYATSITGTTSRPLSDLVQDVTEIQAKGGVGITLLGRAQIPLVAGSRVFFNPRLGALVWRSETDVAVAGSVQQRREDGIGLLVGLGLDFAATRAFHLGLGWELQRPDQYGATNLFYGQVEYHLGQ